MTRERSPILRFAGEFFVIVTGVLVALAADRWNQGRADVAAERAYLDRVEAEIRLDSTRAEAFLAEGPGISAANASLLALVDEGVPPDDLSTTVVTAFREFIFPPPATWNDLQSTGALALIRDLEIRQAILDYYVEREEVGLQVERSVRRGRDPFMDALYPMGLFHPTGEPDVAIDCAAAPCFRPLPPGRFASWPGMRDLIVGLESGHGAQRVHAQRMVVATGDALEALGEIRR